MPCRNVERGSRAVSMVAGITAAVTGLTWWQ